MLLMIFEIIKYIFFKAINAGSQGSKNPEIIEFGGFGPSHNETETSLDQRNNKMLIRIMMSLVKLSAGCLSPDRSGMLFQALWETC